MLHTSYFSNKSLETYALLEKIVKRILRPVIYEVKSYL